MTSTTSSSISGVPKSQSLLPAAPPKPNAPSKKTSKDSKNEKSLETTVEKLTQNRNKEISGKNETAGSAKVANAEKEKGRKVSQETQKPESKAEKSEAGGNNSSSPSLPPPVSSATAAASVPTEVSSEKAKSDEEVARPSEGLETTRSESDKVGVSTDYKDDVVKKSPCVDGGKEEEAGSNTAKSKDLSNNDKVKNGEEVVEGGK